MGRPRDRDGHPYGLDRRRVMALRRRFTKTPSQPHNPTNKGENGERLSLSQIIAGETMTSDWIRIGTVYAQGELVRNP